MRMRVQVEQVQQANTHLTETVAKLRQETIDQQRAAARWEGEFNEAREAGRAEVQRTRTLMEADIEAANQQVNMVRADLENEVARVRSQADLIEAEARALKVSGERALEEAISSKNKAIIEADLLHDTSCKAYERRLDDLQVQHERDRRNAIEDQQRAERHARAGSRSSSRNWPRSIWTRPRRSPTETSRLPGYENCWACGSASSKTSSTPCRRKNTTGTRSETRRSDFVPTCRWSSRSANGRWRAGRSSRRWPASPRLPLPRRCCLWQQPGAVGREAETLLSASCRSSLAEGCRRHRGRRRRRRAFCRAC